MKAPRIKVSWFSIFVVVYPVSNLAYTTSINYNKNKETKENKTTKRLRLTKTKLKDMLEYEQVKETI